ncbi:MAG: TetR family transcriptional regulator [Oscillospiraceae bacterium]
MKADRETRELLMESGKKEFLEKGYMKSSLRKICADAGVTTGALYFFFKDKEDLFGAIAEPPLKTLVEVLNNHFAVDVEAISQPHAVDGGNAHELVDHDDFVMRLVHHIYSNYDAFILLLTKSQGTKYENCVDELVDTIEQFYLALSEKLGTHYGAKVNRYMLHWLTHMIVDSFIHLITHEINEEKAAQYMMKIMTFILEGWEKAVFE